MTQTSPSPQPKPRSAAQLIEELDTDLVWRIQEIAALRRLARKTSGIGQTALLRALVPLLYAHWEGFIKKSAIRYASYISGLGITFGEIGASFSGLKAVSYVRQLHEINKRIFVASEILSALYGLEKDKVTLPLESHISNIGNLSYDLFEQIAEFLSIDKSPYQTKKNLIDETLLASRNRIAHGEGLEIDEESFENLSDEMVAILRFFKDDIQNAVVLRSYIRR